MCMWADPITGKDTGCKLVFNKGFKANMENGKGGCPGDWTQTSDIYLTIKTGALITKLSQKGSTQVLRASLETQKANRTLGSQLIKWLSTIIWVRFKLQGKIHRQITIERRSLKGRVLNLVNGTFCPFSINKPSNHLRKLKPWKGLWTLGQSWSLGKITQWISQIKNLPKIKHKISSTLQIKLT